MRRLATNQRQIQKAESGFIAMYTSSEVGEGQVVMQYRHLYQWSILYESSKGRPAIPYRKESQMSSKLTAHSNPKV